MAPIAHMSENEVKNKHINKMLPIYFLNFVVKVKEYYSYILHLPTAAL